MTLQVQTAASGVARSAHYVIPTGQTQPIQTLLLEPQRTNLLIRSEEFDTWTDLSSCAVTANAIAAPDGTLTADLLTPTSSASARFRAYTATGDGEKCYAIFVKAGTSPQSSITIYDSTAAITRHGIRITWTAGVPVLSTASGTGTIYPVEPLGNGWYRILFTATGIVAANSNTFFCYPQNNAPGTGSAYFWGAQAENAVVPSSYIKTEGTTITRNADSLYFDVPSLNPPRAMTVYVRLRESGNASVGSGWFYSVTSSGGANPRLVGLTSSGRYSAYYENASFVSSQPSGVPVLGDSVEHRTILHSDGSVTGAQAINGNAETIGTRSAAASGGLANAWAAERFYLANTTGNRGPTAYTHVVVAQGEQSLSTMRQLAGVV